MRYEAQQRVLQQLISGLETGTSADAGGIRRTPAADFTCPELALKEQEIFFRQTPLLMGLSADLPEPNTYRATSETGVPILLTRNGDGEFGAFYNACSHRGMQLVDNGRGQTRRFTCPFHAWTYQNSGELIAINREASFGYIDKSSHGLVELPATEKYGMLWVQPSPGSTINVDDILGELADEMDSWALPSHGYGAEQIIEADINWKLAIDTFGENYHFNVLHRDSLAHEIHGNLQTHDVYGQNYRMVFAGVDGFAYAKDMPVAEWPYRWVTLHVYFLYPNTIFLVDPVGIDILRMYPDPDNTGKSRTHHTFYPQPELLEQRRQQEQAAGIDNTGLPVENRFVGFNQIVVNEDYAAAAATQKSARAGTHSHFFFGRNEPALHHYHNAHRKGLGLQLLPLEEA